MKSPWLCGQAVRGVSEWWHIFCVVVWLRHLNSYPGWQIFFSKKYHLLNAAVQTHCSFGTACDKYWLCWALLLMNIACDKHWLYWALLVMTTACDDHCLQVFKILKILLFIQIVSFMPVTRVSRITEPPLLVQRRPASGFRDPGTDLRGGRARRKRSGCSGWLF